MDYTSAFFGVGVYCLYIAYQMEFYPKEAFELILSKPAVHITVLLNKIFGIDENWVGIDLFFNGGEGIKAAFVRLKYAYLGLGVLLVLAFGGVLFVNIGGYKSSDD